MFGLGGLSPPCSKSFSAGDCYGTPDWSTSASLRVQPATAGMPGPFFQQCKACLAGLRTAQPSPSLDVPYFHAQHHPPPDFYWKKGIIADNTESVWSLGQLIRNFYKIKESGETNNALKSSFLYTITSCIEQINFYVKQRFYRFPGSWAHQATQMV